MRIDVEKQQMARRGRQLRQIQTILRDLDRPPTIEALFIVAAQLSVAICGVTDAAEVNALFQTALERQICAWSNDCALASLVANHESPSIPRGANRAVRRQKDKAVEPGAVARMITRSRVVKPLRKSSILKTATKLGV